MRGQTIDFMSKDADKVLESLKLECRSQADSIETISLLAVHHETSPLQLRIILIRMVW